jgi:hypothetical protein
MKSEDASRTSPESSVLQLLQDMQLEAAVERLQSGAAHLNAAEVKALVLDYENRSRRLRAEGGLGEAKRMRRRAHALRGLLSHGPDPARMVAETELPEGYRGKILLVLLKGGVFDGSVCLRSGDDLHREILRNTQAEIADLGFTRTQVHALGGAYAGFDADGGIRIWGTSDEFGCCEKGVAARMIARAYPKKTVRIEE